MKNRPTPFDINTLFNNDDPKVVWDKATCIVRRMSPAYDFTLVQSVYQVSSDYSMANIPVTVPSERCITICLIRWRSLCAV
jgi:hypothetical protein